MSTPVDVSAWPLVWVRPATVVDEDGLDEVLARLNELVRQTEPYVLLFDLTATSVPNASRRRKLAAHMAENREAIMKRVKGLAIVAPTAVQRGFVTAVFWITPPAIPYRIFKSTTEATIWAEKSARTAG